MKLINNRLYLDYNATAPLADTVIQWFSKGALPFANPSSIHTSGKLAKKLINQTTDFLKQSFSLYNHDVLYHSGATEGINDIFKGFCFKNLENKTPFHIVCLRTDHSCVVNQREHVELLGGSFHIMDVNHDGDYDSDAIIEKIKTLSGNVLFNHTYVNNETGVVLPLSKALEIKKATNCLIHVDAVQLVGKLDMPYKLFDQLDFYTFSGHKFGSMKGIGFTFVLNLLDSCCPLIRGGGQQKTMRSGTENYHGIYSIKLALEHLASVYNSKTLRNEKEKLEELLLARYGEKLQIVGANAKYRNYNTLYVVMKDISINNLLTAFDMAQVDISSGSACSSGIVRPSRVLMAMGLDEVQAKSAFRISLPSVVQEGDSQVIFEKLSNILDRF